MKYIHTKHFINYFVTISLVFLLFSGCKHTNTTSFQDAPCLTPDYKDFTFEWGYDNTDSDKIMGYKIDYSGWLVLYEENKNSKQRHYDTLCQIAADEFCSAIDIYTKELLRTPAMNESGKKLTFILLKKPTFGFISRAVWSEHNTFGSRGYREVFDTLMSIVKKCK